MNKLIRFIYLLLAKIMLAANGIPLKRKPTNKKHTTVMLGCAFTFDHTLPDEIVQQLCQGFVEAYIDQCANVLIQDPRITREILAQGRWSVLGSRFETNDGMVDPRNIDPVPVEITPFDGMERFKQ